VAVRDGIKRARVNADFHVYTVCGRK
jgi:hypothetical protein